MRTLGLALIVLISIQSEAFARCLEKGAMLDAMGKYKETPVLSFENNRVRFVIYVGEEGGWTQISFPKYRPDLACIVASGTNFKPLGDKFPKMFPAGSEPISLTLLPSH